MWKHVGIVRDRKSLQSAISSLEALQTELPPPNCRRAQEAHNLLTSGLLIARSALARHESRGAHYRTDYPVHDDAHFKRHSIVHGDSIRFDGGRAAPDSVADPKEHKSTGTAGH